MLREILPLALSMPDPPPILFVGPPGSAKSSRIAQACQSAHLPLETVIASLRDPTDFGGLPILAGGDVRLAPPAWARRLAESGGVLFLDEINTASPATQAALLRVILDRVVGDLPLGPNVRILAAQNPPDQGAGAFDLAPPLANRFGHFAVPYPSFDEWAAFETSGPVPTVLPPMSAFDYTLGLVRAESAAFLHRNPSAMAEMPSVLSGRSIPAFATPRTWSMRNRLAAAWRTGYGSRAPLNVSAAFIGEPLAVEFHTWLDEADLPDPETLLSDPKKLDPKMRPDRLFAALLAVAAAATSASPPDSAKLDDKGLKTLRAERWASGWSVIHRGAKGAEDIAIMSAKRMMVGAPPIQSLPKDCVELIQSCRPILEAAGIALS